MANNYWNISPDLFVCYLFFSKKSMSDIPTRKDAYSNIRHGVTVLLSTCTKTSASRIYYISLTATAAAQHTLSCAHKKVEQRNKYFHASLADRYQVHKQEAS
jgi:hypothetical protein